MLVCHDPPFIYVPPPKTASRSIDTLLRQHYTIETISPYHGAVITPAIEHYFTFGTIRNPFTRLVSLWKFWRSLDGPPRHLDIIRLAKRTPFDRWIIEHVSTKRKQHNIRRARLAVPTMSEIFRDVRLDAIVRFEHLQHDLEQIPVLASRLPLPHAHKNRYDRPWWQHYTRDATAAVLHKYAEDFEQFGYVPDLTRTIMDWVKRRRGATHDYRGTDRRLDTDAGR